WYGIADPDGALSALAAEVRRAVGVPGQPAFRPHLTLARARHEVDLRDWVSHAAAPGGRLVVDRLELMRSHVGSGPARYETLASIRLGVPAHA
ncbi:MAG TPA: 2'-5' RNA ligase family protein, partial [Methylomirabilota bacterium]|nr:2'-5' RNA ligase family protein [Methylomirabilota bacterium]